MGQDEKKQFRMLAARAKELGGWSQAELGRRLKVERATINGIVTGDKDPGKSLLELFRFVFFQAFPQAAAGQTKYPAGPEESVIGMDADEVKSTVSKLREVHSADPDAFSTIDQVVDLAHRNLPKKPGVSSTEPDHQEPVAAAAREAVSSAIQTVHPKKADSTSDVKARKVRSAPARRGVKRSSSNHHPK
jgi:transcriptional regulator with XRE-family HTH domain